VSINISSGSTLLPSVLPKFGSRSNVPASLPVAMPTLRVKVANAPGQPYTRVELPVDAAYQQGLATVLGAVGLAPNQGLLSLNKKVRPECVCVCVCAEVLQWYSSLDLSYAYDCAAK
jgi:hypothetical protein